jgi:hypothetical protein
LDWLMRPEVVGAGVRFPARRAPRNRHRQVSISFCTLAAYKHVNIVENNVLTGFT